MWKEILSLSFPKTNSTMCGLLVTLFQIPEKLPASISNLHSCKQVQRIRIITNYACQNVITFTISADLVTYILGNKSPCRVEGELKNLCKKGDKIYQFWGKRILSLYKFTFNWGKLRILQNIIKTMRIRNQAPNLRYFPFHWRSKPKLSNFFPCSFGFDPCIDQWTKRRNDENYDMN